MDEQTVHPCEAVSQSGDWDSTETDESRDDDAKESSAGEETVAVSAWDQSQVTLRVVFSWRQTVGFFIF